MVLRSVIKTGSNRVDKRNTRLSKLKSHLPFLCACFKGHGKQRRDMITAANRGQIESISEIALNLLKCQCLRKCSRGQKCGSADFDETCSRSWPY